MKKKSVLSRVLPVAAIAIILAGTLIFLKLGGLFFTGESADFTPAWNSLISDHRLKDKNDWKLLLVNADNPIPENYDKELVELRNGNAVDTRIYPELQSMFDAAREEGLMPNITSSYRTSELQQEMLNDKVAAYEAEGNSHERALQLAEKWVAEPGCSEHETGLAVDIASEDSYAQDASVIWQWLAKNSYKYGFILRYPQDKEEITGVIYEPWHFRYVGETAAKDIYDQGICLEEYLNGDGE